MLVYLVYVGLRKNMTVSGKKYLEIWNNFFKERKNFKGNRNDINERNNSSQSQLRLAGIYIYNASSFGMNIKAIILHNAY